MDKYIGIVQIMKSDPGQNNYCIWDTHEAIITKEDFAQVQKEIDRRNRKRRMHASAASKLIESIGWPDPKNVTKLMCWQDDSARSYTTGRMTAKTTGAILSIEKKDNRSGKERQCCRFI